jgi:hypothetical protein
LPKIDAKFDKKVRESGKIEKNPEKLKILKLNRADKNLFFGTRNPKKCLNPRISVLSICVGGGGL